MSVCGKNPDDNNAEVSEPTSESASSNLPAEAASSSSAPTASIDPALPASATEVPDQVMSEGASSSSDAAVRLSMKRSSDGSNSKSETKRLHTDHSTRDVVMLLDDSDVSHAVERVLVVWWSSGEQSISRPFVLSALVISEWEAR